jgi:hypothetical protein
MKCLKNIPTPWDERGIRPAVKVTAALGAGEVVPAVQSGFERCFAHSRNKVML